MNSLFTLDTIRVDEKINDQQEAFKRIAGIAFENGITESPEDVAAGLKEREKEGTTGFLEGFAIPHTKSAAVKEPAVIVIRTTEGIEWQSLDGEPVSFIISLLIPEEEKGTTHLTLLSHISRLLIHAEVRRDLRGAADQAGIVEVLGKAAVSQ
ncbi:PTS sugar transporter subunit IIA [Peribacillus sp. SCS-26]|uniref:PTS sugar transporter subunit IIA n=1 Tax=Paraperibacillus marinus TaxID=3115295 RepID=UPI0039062CDB